MKRFNNLNNLTGWLVFTVAFATYSITVERTASFWDCAEFIAAAFKLEVPHPPGAPFFLLIGRIFSLLALGDLSQVAYWINMVSVLSSAFTILFLFWTITLLTKKIVAGPDSIPSPADTFLIMGAGVVGALAYTWSDSFWFSAVEAEVYAMSSFFTAIVIWAVFKWEQMEDPAAANRWLVFISYLIGLSIGVHLLNLVTIPALALVFYLKKYPKPGVVGGLIALGTGMVILTVINTGIIPGLPEMAGKFEIFFVNTLDLPYNSGVLFFIILFLGSLVWGIRFSHLRGMPGLNTTLLCLAFILTGYTSYLMVLVRSGYNPPINENSPDDVLSFVYYLKREQYGNRPLLYGPSYVARPTGLKKLSPVYRKKDGKYAIIDYRQEYEYAPGSSMLLPRMYSSQPGHPELYQSMTGLADGQKPTMVQNLSFLFSYQMGTMYWRYFLWNFSGRMGDAQGAGTLLPWDAFKAFPTSISAGKAHDNYFMLPLLLGIAGLLLLYFHQKKDLIVLAMLFVLTGIGLVVYLNSPPTEPRERDYIYVGSFYVFCIWIGMGVVACTQAFSRVLKQKGIRAITATALCLGVPMLMGIKGWDNHDRRNRFHSVDFARNLLSSCAPNAILFTGADTDTFPLWYVQEVEGFRTDVRVCVQTFMGADWYIRQLRRKINRSDALPMTLEMANYITGKNDIVPFYEIPGVKSGINLNEYLQLIKQDNKALQVPLTSGDMTSVLPSSVLFLPVNTAEVDSMKIVKKDLQPFIGNAMYWTIGNKDLYKGDLVMLDIIATNNWKRPIYFSSTMGKSNHLGLTEYMQLEGYAYRLLPARVEGAQDGYVNTDIMFNNMMNKMAWRELNNKDTYYDDTYRGAPIVTARMSFLRLAEQLVNEKRIAEARQVAERAIAVMPDDTIPYDQASAGFTGIFFDINERKKALQLADTMARRSDENLRWARQNPDSSIIDVNADLFILQSIVRSCRHAGEDAAAEEYERIFKKHLVAFNYIR
ncbi:glycosyltransferase family 117 protein [Dyadobacter helix]|nr:DUF2723 domain-containing protein [Dyadobacter sp. CECT 9275]